MNQQVMAKGEIRGSGEISKEAPAVNEARSVASAISDMSPKAAEMLAKSNLTPFNTNTVADGLKDDDKDDGGRTQAKSTGTVGMTDIGGSGFTLNQPEQDNKVELYGFDVRFMIPGTNAIESQKVRIYFNNVKDAQMCVNGTKFTYKLNDKITIDADIAVGRPMIAIDGRQVYEYKQLENGWVWYRQS